MSVTAFSIPAFRFSLDVAPGQNLGAAIGKWSRGATYGDKSAKGDGLVFTPEILSRMVDNVAARGDKISICADHKSAYVATTGQPAPSLGFFYALAVFADGQMVKHWAFDGGAPPAAVDDSGQPRDGLYCRLGEITPLGLDPIHGLANYGFLSPMFQPDGKREDGAEVGYSLIDFGATSTPFQAGCPIQFSNGVHTMARDDVKIERTGDGRWRVFVDRGNGFDVVGEYNSESEAKSAAERAPYRGFNRANPGVASAFAFGTWKDLARRHGATSVDESGTGGWNSAKFRDRSTADGFADDVNTGIGQRPQVVQSPMDPNQWIVQIRMSGGNMNPEMLKKLGLADDADDAAKMTAMKKFTGDAMTKMAVLDPAACGVMADDLEKMAEMAGDDDKASMKTLAKKYRAMAGADTAPAMADPPHKEPDGDECPADMAALAMSLGVNVKGKTRAQVMDAISASAVPASKVVEMSRLAAKEAIEAEKAANRAEENKRKSAVLMAALPASVPAANRAAIQRVADRDPDEAALLAQPWLPKDTGAPAYLFSRLTSQGGPVGQPGARTMEGPSGPKIIRSKVADTVVSDEDEANEIKALAFSTDPVRKAKVDALMGSNETEIKHLRLIAARKVLMSEQPERFDAADRQRILMSVGVR